MGAFGAPDHEKTKNDGTIVSTDGLPCSSLTAIWVMMQLGKEPTYKKDAQGNTIYDWQRWYRLDKVMWNAINMKSGGVGDTSCIPYIQSFLGGTIANYPLVLSDSKDTIPYLTAGRWHIIQRWKRNSGHSYMVYYGGGTTVRKVQSSRANLYRDQNVSIDSWFQEGAQEMVLTLPYGMKEIDLGFTYIQLAEEAAGGVAADSGAY